MTKSPAILVREDRIDIIFTCVWAHGALFIDKKLGKPLCTNNRSWRAIGMRIAPDLIRVERGGHCPGCGYMGTAHYPDEYAGCTVEVNG